jgi:hypothetical protein
MQLGWRQCWRAHAATERRASTCARQLLSWRGPAGAKLIPPPQSGHLLRLVAVGLWRAGSSHPGGPAAAAAASQFFAAQGWQVGVRRIWTDSAAAYGHQASGLEADDRMNPLPQHLRPQDLAAVRTGRAH